MKNNFLLLLVVVLSMFAVSPALAVGKVTVDPNTVKKVEAPAPEPVGAADKRFDQKITFDAPNARLHDVVATIAEKSGVTIFCGSSPDDWRVRDIPVTVAARDITLRKLLEYLLFSTHTYLKETKSDKGSVYRIKRDARLQKMLDDYEKALEDYKMARLKWSLEAACKLKDIPISEIKPPRGAPSDWWDSIATQREASKLLAALDSDTKAQLLAGEPLLLSPRTAPAGLREVVLGYLRAADSKFVNNMQAQYARSDSANMPNIRNGVSSDFEGGCIRLLLNQTDISLNSILQVQDSDNYKGRSSYDSVSEIAYTTSGNNKGRLSLPKEPQYPQDPKMEPSNKDLKYLRVTDDLNKKIALIFEDSKDNKPVYPAEALIALSKQTGMSIVCEDFHTHCQENNLRSSTSSDLPIYLLQRILGIGWMMDNKEKVFVGFEHFWPAGHKNLIPESVVENIKAKANGGGVDFDDFASLALYTFEAVSTWFPSATFQSFPHWTYTQPENRPIWILYASLSANSKALAKSKSGITIGEIDLKTVIPWLKERAKNDYDNLYDPEVQKPAWTKWTDPAVVPNLVMRVQTNEMTSSLDGLDLNSGEVKIPRGFVKRHSCILMIEGTAGKDNLSLSVDGGYQLPYFSQDREKELTEALKKLKEKGK